MIRRRPVRVLVALSGVVLVTYVGYHLIPVNATTVGFAYLLLILIVASTSGFLEAALSSLLATLLFNFFPAACRNVHCRRPAKLGRAI